MDERFKKVEDQYFGLKGQFAAGRITREQLEAALKNAMVQDAQGRYWVLGVDDAKWYMHDGQNWVGSEPPSSTSAAVCPACGRAECVGEEFCGYTGQRIRPADSAKASTPSVSTPVTTRSKSGMLFRVVALVGLLVLAGVAYLAYGVLHVDPLVARLASTAISTGCG